MLIWVMMQHRTKHIFLYPEPGPGLAQIVFCYRHLQFTVYSLDSTVCSPREVCLSLPLHVLSIES